MEIKLSILILSSNTYPSVRNSKIQKKVFFNQNELLNEVYWYKKGLPKTLNGSEAKLIGNDLFINADDSSLGMGYKTIKAFEWLLKNSDFEYVFRTNTSSYVSIKNLQEHIIRNLKNKEYVYSGLIHETNDKSNKKIEFASGSGFLLNRKVVELIVKEQHYWDHYYWDDVSLGLLLKKFDILPDEGRRFDITGNPFKQKIDLTQYHFRCRIDNHYKYPRFLEYYVINYLNYLDNYIQYNASKKYIMNLVFEFAKLLYIQEFTWKCYLLIRKLLKFLLPNFLYNYIKYKFKIGITNFKLKRFKT